MKISDKQRRELEKNHNWNFIDHMALTVPVDLTDVEKLELGKEMTDSIQSIEELEAKKNSFNDQIKGEMADKEEKVRQSARTLRRGKKDVEKVFPVFFEAKTDQRLFFDPETSEIVRTEPGLPADRQLKMA